MEFVERVQGTQVTMGSTAVGIMRVGDADGRGVAQLMIRSVEGDFIETAFEGDEVAIPGDGVIVIGSATPPGPGHPRWRIRLGHRTGTGREASPTS